MKEQAQRSLNPGDNGTKKLKAEYGSKLVKVRYRYDHDKKIVIKTVELIISRKPIQKRVYRKDQTGSSDLK
ncbi:hypothetical protein JW964_25530 [candidate division KSB1 bacterium]|nr:hypothetical protein [candidate division KSB1 bacterium]